MDVPNNTARIFAFVEMIYESLIQKRTDIEIQFDIRMRFFDVSTLAILTVCSSLPMCPRGDPYRVFIMTDVSTWRSLPCVHHDRCVHVAILTVCSS